MAWSWFGSIRRLFVDTRISLAFVRLRPKMPAGFRPDSNSPQAPFTRGHWQRGLSAARHAHTMRGECTVRFGKPEGVVVFSLVPMLAAVPDGVIGFVVDRSDAG